MSTMDYAHRRVRVRLGVHPCRCFKCKCPKAVNKLWAKLAGVEKIYVKPEFGIVIIEGSLDNDLIDRAINKMKLLCMTVYSVQVTHFIPEADTFHTPAADEAADEAANSLSSMRISDDGAPRTRNNTRGIVFREPRAGGYSRSSSSSSSSSGSGRPPRVPGEGSSRANRKPDDTDSNSSGTAGCGYQTPQSCFSGDGDMTPQPQFSNNSSSSSHGSGNNNGEIQNLDFGEYIFGSSNDDSDDQRNAGLTTSGRWSQDNLTLPKEWYW